ncbi:MAG: hypothetical protein KAS62_11710 [Candidatus Delongbacteria bacterium]|nr:hypothetical protein [Candidatus Delongbacteria bacterium]
MKNLVIILFLLGSIAMFAKDQIVKENPLITKKNSIGVRYSGISGYGLNMQRRIFENYTIKFTGLIHYSEYIKGEPNNILEDRKNILYDYGFELQRDFFKNEGMRASAIGGIYFSNQEKKDEENGIPHGENKTEDKIAGGVGVSLEFYVKRTISLNFDFGYIFVNTEGEEEDIPVKENKTQLGLGIGLSYLF